MNNLFKDDKEELEFVKLLWNYFHPYSGLFSKELKGLQPLNGPVGLILYPTHSNLRKYNIEYTVIPYYGKWWSDWVQRKIDGDI